jgi:hypothetical protein
MEKDATVTELLSWLRQRLGNRFVVTDHWDADLCAVGISAPNDPAQLVYISSWGRPAGHYGVELESAPLPGSDAPYQTVGEFQAVNREELLRIVENHLRISN